MAAGGSSGVEVVDDVVACCDETLLPDAFRVGGWLSVVGPGVVQPVWVNGLICADLTARATTDARNVFASYVIGCCLLIGTWRYPLPI